MILLKGKIKLILFLLPSYNYRKILLAAKYYNLLLQKLKCIYIVKRIFWGKGLHGPMSLQSSGALANG